MTPDELVRRLRDEATRPPGVDVLGATGWSNGPSDQYPPHEHAYDKALVAVAGSITFTLPGTGDEAELRAGDRLDLPAGTPHGAVVGPDGVRCVEAHLPEGWLPARTVHRGWVTAETSRPRGA